MRALIVAFLLVGFALPSAQAQDIGEDSPASEFARDSLFAAFRGGEYARTVYYADNLIEAGHFKATAYLVKGRALFMLDSLEAGVGALSKAIERSPSDLDARYYRGLLYGKMRDYDAALEDLNVVATARPDDLRTKSTRAWYLAENGLYEKSIALYNELLKEARDPQQTLALRAEVKYRSGNVRAALDDMEKAIALAPDAPFPYQSRAEIFLREQKHENARHDLNRAIQLHDGQYAPRLRAVNFNNRGYVRLKAGEVDQAAKDVKRALELYDANPFVYRNRALVNLKRGDRRTACADLELALAHGFYTKFSEKASYGPDVKALKQRHCRD